MTDNVFILQAHFREFLQNVCNQRDEHSLIF